MGNSYVSGARPYGTTGLEIRRIANNSRVSQNLSVSFRYLWNCELSAAQRKPAQLVDGLFPPETLFQRNIISLCPEFAGYDVLARFRFARVCRLFAGPRLRQSGKNQWPESRAAIERWKWLLCALIADVRALLEKPESGLAAQPW